MIRISSEPLGVYCDQDGVTIEIEPGMLCGTCKALVAKRDPELCDRCWTNSLLRERDAARKASGT